ncbi:MAG: hypothetical protein A2Y36_04245 [Treponema sp. GWA1_62_8]|nr:MAG: hypothetical protein A2Y36_04245 [Treponema sp. GWA1_62_8]
MNSSGTYTVKEVAAFLRITAQAVYNLIKREEIAAFKVGSAVRILNADLDAYVERRKRLFAAQNASYEAPAEGSVAARRICARFPASGNDVPGFALDSVSFEIPAGSTLGILGSSGSGKTLLLKALAGLVNLDAGAFFMGSRRLDLLASHERRIGLVFQDYALYPMLDGGGNIAFPLKAGHAAKETIDPAVERIAAELGIEPSYLPKRIAALPEGIKQLVAIGRAENRPAGRQVELFLMDEPLVHLDARLREETRAFLKRLVASFGATTIYAFNEAVDALALSDRLLLMRDGAVVQFGPTAEVFSRPAAPDLMELLSLNGVSELSGVYADGEAEITGLGAVVPASLPADAPRGYRGRVRLLFRTEEVEPASIGDPSALRALIERSAPYGGERVLASGPVVAFGASEPADDAPRVTFVAPEETEGIAVFKPKGAMAYPFPS